jgi:hypothetical protein
MGKLFTLPLFLNSVWLVRTGKGGKEGTRNLAGRQKNVKTTLREVLFGGKKRQSHFGPCLVL